MNIETCPICRMGSPYCTSVKRDGEAVHICGDFKQTVNAADKVDRHTLPKVHELFATLAVGNLLFK